MIFFYDPHPLDFLGLGGIPVDLSYILSDNVSLYCMYSDMVVFVETPNDADIYDPVLHPYLTESQLCNAHMSL